MATASAAKLQAIVATLVVSTRAKAMSASAAPRTKASFTLTAPLELAAGIEQATPHEPHRFVAEGEGFVLQARIAGEWQALYAFDLHEQVQADYEVSNWYLANFPQSQFVTGIIAARADVGERHALRNTRYAIHHASGETERRFLGTVAEVKAVLREAMRIPLPEHPDLDARIQSMIAANPSS